MKIETKFNVGDKVFVIWENKVYRAIVIDIDIRVSRLPMKIIYQVQFETAGIIGFHEERLFATKQELIDSL